MSSVTFAGSLGKSSQKIKLSDFTCSLTHQLVQRPVFLHDEPGHFYHLGCLEEWNQYCVDNNQPFVSPRTKNKIRCYIKEGSSPIESDVLSERLQAESIASLLDLRSIFAPFRGAYDVLDASLHHWQPPQVITVGEVGSGKSALLERICTLPLFPHGNGASTRFPLRVCLRHAPAPQIPTLAIHNWRTQVQEGATAMVPISWAVEKIGSAMDTADEQCARERQKWGGLFAAAERCIVMRLAGPQLPNLDILELPGLFPGPCAEAERRRKLAKEAIRRAGAGAICIITVPAARMEATDPALDLAEQCGALRDGRVVAVRTMCDEAPARALARLTAATGSAPSPSIGSARSRLEWATVALPSRPASSFGVTRPCDWPAREAGEAALAGAALRQSGLRADTATVIERVLGAVQSEIARTWAPKAQKLLEAAAAKTAAERASLQPPTKDEEGREAAAREAAVMLAASRVKAAERTLFESACQGVVEALRKQLQSIQVARPARARTMEAWAEAERSTAERVAMERACTDGAEAWAMHWSKGIKHALTANCGADSNPGRLDCESESATAAKNSAKKGDAEPLPSDFLKEMLLEVETAHQREALEATAELLRVVSAFQDNVTRWSCTDTNLVQGPVPNVTVRRGIESMEGLARAAAYVLLRRGAQPARAVVAAMPLAAARVTGWRTGWETSRQLLAARLANLGRASAAVGVILPAPISAAVAGEPCDSVLRTC